MKLPIKFTGSVKVPLPTYQSSQASGLDLYAAIEAKKTLYAQCSISISTGIAIELPCGYEGQIRPRSGLAFNRKIVGFFGTIDADYRGELHVLLFNRNPNPVIIAPLDRIGQLVISPVQRVLCVPKENLTPTLRGAKGFGSTG